MPDFYFTVNLDEERTLCLAPLTNRKLALVEDEIEDPSGYFLFECRGRGERATIEIIAKVHSEEAVFRLRDIFKMG